MLKITITTLFLTIKINFELTFKVVCLFIKSEKLLLLLLDLGGDDNFPGHFDKLMVYTPVGLIISQWFTTGLQHTCTVLWRLVLTAALSGTQVENVAFRLKSLPTHVLATC